MDLSCIIESGDLELYVLGMLPQDEADKIEQLASLFPEVREELNRIAASLEGLSATANIAPSPLVKVDLMNRLKLFKEQEETPLAEAPVIPLQDRREGDSKVAPSGISSSQKRTNALLAASIIGLIFSIGIVIYLATINRQSRVQLATLHQQMDTLRNDYVSQQQQLQAYDQTLQMMHSDAYKQIQLTSVPGKPKALADVFWNLQTHEVYVANITLPETPANKQYQLWAIVDGKPIDAGLLNGSTMQTQQMKTFEKADAFAITLEKKGGSPTPTMDAMYVMSKTS